MRIPFTTDQFLDVFRQYNQAVWPAQWALHVLALIAVLLLFRDSRWAGRWISGVLAVLWLWMGAVYHLIFFRPINPAAIIFGALFVAQAALFAWAGVWQGRLTFRARPEPTCVLAGLLLVYALVLYPMLGRALGHVYPAAPTFGLPCPTTLFTIGVLMLATPAVPRVLLLVPLLWVVVGTSGAVQLGMREDFGLLAAGLVAMSVLVTRVGPRRRAAPSAS